MDPNIEESGRNYKLLTGNTKDPIKCPEGDICAQSQEDGTVKVTFLKKCRIVDGPERLV